MLQGSIQVNINMYFRTLFCVANISAPLSRPEMVLYSEFTYVSQFLEEMNSFENCLTVHAISKKFQKVNFFIHLLYLLAGLKNMDIPCYFMLFVLLLTLGLNFALFFLVLLYVQISVILDIHTVGQVFLLFSTGHYFLL